MTCAAGIVIFADLDEQGLPRAKRPCLSGGREVPVLSVPNEEGRRDGESVTFTDTLHPVTQKNLARSRAKALI
jgi:hypothetical protein